MTQLRPYQESTRARCEASWAAGKKRPLIVLPTGGGKTEVATSLLAPARSPMAIVHTDTLLEQTARRIPRARVYTIQALTKPGAAGDRRRELLRRHDRCFVDEAHHLAAGLWSTVLPWIEHLQVFGATATPKRSDGTPLGDCFDELIVGAKYSELIAAGHLVRCDVWSPNISRRDQKEMKVRPDGVAAFLENARRADDSGWRPGIHFEVTIEACQTACQRYNEAGVRAAVVDCNTDTDARREIFARYTAGALDMLCSPTALAEGFDSPRAEVCVLRRSCDHLGDYLQRVGRVLRPFPGKERALLIDITNVRTKHGLPTDDRVYSLEGKGIANMPTPEEQEQAEAELRPPTVWQSIEARYTLIRDTLLSRYRDLQAQAAELGYKPGWVWHRFTEATSISAPLSFPAKYQSTCVHCRKRLKLGELMFWPASKTAYHEQCWFASLDGEKLEHAQAALEVEHTWRPARKRDSFDACADEVRGRPYSSPTDDDIPF
jgi:DNA repair protein RadD